MFGGQLALRLWPPSARHAQTLALLALAGEAMLLRVVCSGSATLWSMGCIVGVDRTRLCCV